jgi:hypothetical protein
MSDAGPTKMDWASVKILLYELMDPARGDTRRANERALCMATEWAYYRSLGDAAATKKTAALWCVSRRTVTNAVRQFGEAPRVTGARDPTRRKFFDQIRLALAGTPARKQKR